jgi:signal transduction histidine kinase
MMDPVRLKSLRVRLLAIVAVSVVPAFGLIVYTGFEQRREAVNVAQQAAVRLARLAASEQGRRLGAARELLIALSRLPEVRRRDGPACRRVLADLLRHYDLYLNFGAVDERGRVFCSALPAPESTDLGDRPYFQRAVATRGFAVGDYQVGRITGKASLNVAYPLLDERGTVRGVVFAAIDLGWLRQLVRDARLPHGSTFTVIDRHGTVLVRHPDEDWVGRAHPQLGTHPRLPVVGALRPAGTAGLAEARGEDGVVRLLGFTPLLDGGTAGDVYVSIGIPKQTAVAAANRLLAWNLTGLGLVTGLAVVAAWYAGDAFVVRRVNRIVAAARRLADGDLSARAGGPYAGELGELARAFDEMAEAIRDHQAARVRSEKLAAIGRLAAGVAHELRNPLTVIDGRLQLLEREVARDAPDPEKLGRHLTALAEASQRMRRIMDGLSSYSKPAKAEPVPLDVRGLLAAARELVGYAARNQGVTVEVDAPDDLPPILGERSEMMQILVNLAMNAIEAMEGGGRLRLRARLDPATPGGRPIVVLEVEDTGPGIPPEKLATIWEPFYTTKAEGTGLGLSIVRGLVDKQPGATISVRSLSGAGTTFTLRMPALVPLS